MNPTTTDTLCSSCHAPIAWLPTIGGKMMPVDCEPTPDGNLLLGGDPAAVIIHVKPEDKPKILRQLEALGKPAFFYTSHFATCPNAAQHRKARS